MDVKLENIKPDPDADLCSTPSYEFDCFVGTNSGILKGIQLTNHGAVVRNYPVSKSLERGNEITALCWRDDQKKEILVAHYDRTVSLFNTETLSYICKFPVTFGSGKIVSITQQERQVMVGVESGHIGNLFMCTKKEGTVSKFVNTVARSTLRHKHKPKLAVVKHHPADSSRIATGGCENDLKLWDLHNPAIPVFSARNVANDTLDLRVPVWVTDLTFMQDNRTIAVVSRHKCVRLYDPHSKRKPVMNLNYEDSPLTCVATVPDKPGCILLGTAHGRVTLFDLRAGKVRNRAPLVFKGINGGIKGLAMEEPPLAYSVSLDRHLRVHNLHTKETVHKEYMKSKLTTVLVC